MEISEKFQEHLDSQLWEGIIQSDPTLKQNLRTGQFDTKNFDRQVELYAACIQITLWKYLDSKY